MLRFARSSTDTWPRILHSSFAKQAPVKRSLSAVVLLKIDGVGFNDEQVFDAMLGCAIRKYATSVVTRQWFCNRETRPGAQTRVLTEARLAAETFSLNQ